MSKWLVFLLLPVGCADPLTKGDWYLDTAGQQALGVQQLNFTFGFNQFVGLTIGTGPTTTILVGTYKESNPIGSKSSLKFDFTSGDVDSADLSPAALATVLSTVPTGGTYSFSSDDTKMTLATTISGVPRTLTFTVETVTNTTDAL